MATARNNPNLNYSPDRLVSAAAVEDDSSFELKLRPQRLAEFIGQKKVKEQLAVAIEAARSRGEAMDHVLLYGPPGLGKTTLANIIANELAVHFQPTAAPLLQIKGDLTAIITNPPFGTLARRFIQRALALTREANGKVAILQRHEFDAPRVNWPLFEWPFAAKLVLRAH